MESAHCHRIYLTRILKDYQCDVFFPEVESTQFTLIKDPNVSEEVQEEDGVKYRFEVYEKIN
jgi:dihydrofolate reductase